MSLVRKMQVNAVAHHVEVADTRLWRIVHYYVAKAITALNLKGLKAIGLDETASKRGTTTSPSSSTWTVPASP